MNTFSRKTSYLLLMVATVMLVFNSCKKEETIDPNNNNNNNNNGVKIDPSNPDKLSGVLIINGDVKQGNPPAPSSDFDAPDVDNNQTSASSTVDNTLYLPFTYESASTLSSGYGGCYIQVEGARTYWDIPPPSSITPLSGQLIIPVGIPSNVDIGTFTLLYCIYDPLGRVSNILQTTVTIAPPGECPANESGSDGLTIFTVDLGNQSGIVTISYDTYSIPDRVDVFYNDRWVDGTGNSLSSGQFPPALDCDDATPADGYVGEVGSFTLNYNPRDGSTVDVYVSGCIGGGTAWDIEVSCPQ